MSLKAEWRLRELMTGEKENPFDTVILSSGLMVDLTGTAEEIYQGLRESLQLESRLHNRGITCELKDGGQDCLTCPMYVADRAEEPRAPLCRLGRDQRLLEKRSSELVSQPFVELVGTLDQFAEIGHLSDERAALLTAVGL